MSLINRFLGLFQADASPAGVAGVREAYGINIDKDEDQWRPLTGDTLRDLSPVTQERMQKIASKLWESNLLANALVELVVAFLIAEGVRLTVKDKANQRLLDRFWRDPINNMDVKLPQYIREMELYGEQCYPVFVGAEDVRIGYLDPMLIGEIVMDPDNPSQPIGVVTKKNNKGLYKKYRVIINGAEDAFTNRTQQIRATGFTDGDCFLFQVNKLASGKRGRSALLAPADWLDAYDEFMFGEQDRARFMRSFFYDVTLKGATPDDVKTRASQISAPGPGSVRVHNDSEEWKVEAPNLQAADSSEHARMFRNHILGGARMPEHWYGGGGDVNRASASEMGEPTFKSLALRQGLWKSFLEQMGRYVLRRAGSTEPEFDDEAFNVVAEFPELTAKDTTKWAAALQQVSASMVIAIGQGLITQETAVRMIGAIAERLGVQFDAEKELEEAQTQAAARREEDNFNGNAQPGDTEPPAAPAATPAPEPDISEAIAESLARLAEANEHRFNELAERISANHQGEPLDAAGLLDTVRHINQEQRAQFDTALAGMREAFTELAKRPVTLAMPETEREIELPDGRRFALKTKPITSPTSEGEPST
jgi:hypothetical protein